MTHSTEQVYYSTLTAYQNIMEQFNPGLQNLVLLGSNFVRAFRTLTTAANIYFVAVGKLGEQALRTSTSQILGQVLLQMADTQRELSKDLELIFRRFNDELLREMEHNTQLDVEYISKNKYRFEKEHRERAEVLKYANEELHGLERMKHPHARDVQERICSLEAGMESFLNNSYKLALTEERRRYRFLVENHFHLSCYFLSFYSKAREALQNKVPAWKEHSSSTSSGRASPLPSNIGAPLTTNDGPNADTISRYRFMPSPQPSRRELNGAELSPFSNPEPGRREERNPSIRPPSTDHLSHSGLLGDKVHSLTSKRVKAVISHSADGNQTMLNFKKDDVITILVPEAKNGWLYGKLEGTSKLGWFPHSYVQPLQGEMQTHEPSLRPSPMRSRLSSENLLEPKEYVLPSADYSSLPPPPSPARSQSPALPNPRSRRNSAISLAVSESSQSRMFGGPDTQHELFPRGTNPFATVKLKPTVTNDRSTPFIQ
ncbi:BAR/IMD domain-containing adapter protein 2-like 2 [Narcine bancroftii]|uniref:BAR/IMD domain-containing adapter protein 2-like 2 n=1 Tax=Narcine bancroftii TaxID=1343680 RepID=UPI003831485F